MNNRAQTMTVTLAIGLAVTMSGACSRATSPPGASYPLSLDSAEPAARSVERPASDPSQDSGNGDNLTPTPTSTSAREQPGVAKIPVTSAAAGTPALATVNNDVLCVPPSLMLHSKDRYMLTMYLIPWLKEKGYTTITYQDYVDQLNDLQPRSEKPIILSIDDVSTEYINPYFYAMIEALHAEGMVAVLGVVPKEPPESEWEVVQENYHMLQLWGEWGFELADHTIDHVHLLSRTATEVDYQIGEAARRIEKGTGFNVSSLILPYGAGEHGEGFIDQRIFDAAIANELSVVVGIVGGRYVDTASVAAFGDYQYPYYLGRVGPAPGFGSAAWEIEHWYRLTESCRHLMPTECRASSAESGCEPEPGDAPDEEHPRY